MTTEDKNKKIKENPDLSELADELDEKKSLESVAESNGGKLLIKGLVTDIIDIIEALSGRYKEATMQEFVGWGAEISTKLEMLRALRQAKKNREFLKKELDQALSE